MELKHTEKRYYRYSGMALKIYLDRKSKSYKTAAADLGINKNTVGKLVRGGNVNIDILLRVCNGYGLPIQHFFREDVLDDEYPVTNLVQMSHKDKEHIPQIELLHCMNDGKPSLPVELDFTDKENNSDIILHSEIIKYLQNIEENLHKVYTLYEKHIATNPTNHLSDK